MTGQRGTRTIVVSVVDWASDKKRPQGERTVYASGISQDVLMNSENADVRNEQVDRIKNEIAAIVGRELKVSP